MFKYANIVLTKPREKYWTIVKMTVRIRKYFYMSEYNPIFHNGQCLCLEIHGRLAIFDPKDLEGTLRISGTRFPQKIKDRGQAFMV